MAPPFGLFSSKKKIKPLLQYSHQANKIAQLFEKSDRKLSLLVISAYRKQANLYEDKARVHLKHFDINLVHSTSINFDKSDLNGQGYFDIVFYDYQCDDDIKTFFKSLCEVNQAMPLIVGINEATNKQLHSALNNHLDQDKLSKCFIAGLNNPVNCWRLLKDYYQTIKRNNTYTSEKKLAWEDDVISIPILEAESLNDSTPRNESDLTNHSAVTSKITSYCGRFMCCTKQATQTFDCLDMPDNTADTDEWDRNMGPGNSHD